MENLRGADLLLACRVLSDRYKQCVKGSIVHDVLEKMDASAPTRKCGGLFADLQDYCGDRNGAIVTPK